VNNKKVQWAEVIVFILTRTNIDLENSGSAS